MRCEICKSTICSRVRPKFGLTGVELETEKYLGGKTNPKAEKMWKEWLNGKNKDKEMKG